MNADAHLNELEQVANDAQAANNNNEYGDYYGEGYGGEYGYEGYGAEGYGAEGYGAEGYGQEGEAPEKNNWGEQEQKPKAPEVSKVEAFRMDSMKSAPKAPSKVEVVPESEEIMPEIQKAHHGEATNTVDNNISNDLNDIEDMDVDQQVNNEDLPQTKPPNTKGANNKEAEILDIDDIPEFE